MPTEESVHPECHLASNWFISHYRPRPFLQSCRAWPGIPLGRVMNFLPRCSGRQGGRDGRMEHRLPHCAVWECLGGRSQASFLQRCQWAPGPHVATTQMGKQSSATAPHSSYPFMLKYPWALSSVQTSTAKVKSIPATCTPVTHFQGHNPYPKFKNTLKRTPRQ